MAKNCPNW
jgi:hypothetical protein